MPEVFFDRPHNFNPTSTLGSSNVLSLLSNPANYTVVFNDANSWVIQLTTPSQAIAFIEFYPAEGATFTPGPGKTPPAGIVDFIIFSDTLIGDIFVQFQSLAALGFGAGQLIADTTRVVSGDDSFFGSDFGSPLGETFFAGPGNDLLVGFNGNDTLSGDAGDDVILGGAGNDNLNGGAGIDLVSYLEATVGVTVTLATPGVAQVTGEGTDTLTGFEQLEGGAFDDTLTGSAASEAFLGFDGDDIIQGAGGGDLLLGELGDDVLVGGAGDDDIDGGDGLDLASFINAPGGVTVTLATPGAVQSTGEGLDILISIEGLEGSAFDDTLSGSGAGETFFGFDGDDVIQAAGGDDSVFGEAGNDVILGGDGVDTLDGGGGDDTFLQSSDPFVDAIAGGAGFDLIDYGFATQGVVVQLSGYATSGGVLIATFTGIEDARGSNFDDALIGADDDNFLFGGEGADWMVGGAGNDLFSPGTGGGVDRLFGGTAAGDAGIDVIDYTFAAAGGVIVQLNGWATTNAGALLATFSGIEDAIGTSENDALIGSNADNFLIGGAGADWLVGGGGDDTFVQTIDAGDIDQLFGGAPGADAGIDTIDYSGEIAGVIVQLSGYATSGAVTIATFADIENAVGTSLDDALIGNAGANRIEGGQGADWLVGGDGDDTFVQGVDATSIDSLFGGAAGADSGNDTIDYSTASAGVAVQLSGYATTNSGGPATTLATFQGIENAVGSSFADALIGDASANVITGGAGIDWLVGGAGADTFIYRAVENTQDSIRDFTADDLIDLAAIDANPTTGGDDAFVLATVRHAGVVGEAVVTNFGGSSLVSLYLDADNIPDMAIQVVHQNGFVMSAGDFVL